MILPGVLTELVAALGESAPSIPLLADHASHDALLTLTLLKCARESVAEPHEAASLTLVRAIEMLGLDFMRILVLTAQPGVVPVASWETGIRVAHLARLIAVRTRQCEAEVAWLTGLSHNLREYPQFGDPDKRENWLAALDPQGFAADAVRYCRAAPARVRSAHPLVRVLHLAVSLVYSLHVSGNGNVSVVGVRSVLNGLGLEAAETARLQAESDTLAQETLRRYAANHEAMPADSLTQGYAAMARASALSEALNGADSREALAQRAGLLMRGLFGVQASALLQRQPERMQPAAWWLVPWGLMALPLPVDDMQSAVCRASAGEIRYWDAAQAEQYPVMDAQLARLLRVSSILCIPLNGGDVLVAGNVSESLAADTGWQAFLRVLAARLARLDGRGGKFDTSPVEALVDAVPRQEVRRAVHEAANPLTIIRNYVDLLSGKFSGDSETQRDLAIIGDEIERVGTILQSLGAKPETSSAAENTPGTWVDVNQIISELIRMSLDTLFLPNKINVQIDLDPGIGSILTQRDPLKQVLLNLAKNAVEAMLRGGKLTFATARTKYKARNCVVIVMHDTGPGLPETVRAQLFQPVPTFKGGDHAGLGLAISQNLVRAMGGDIEYDNSPDGATFRIYLPMAQEDRAAAHTSRP